MSSLKIIAAIGAGAAIIYLFKPRRIAARRPGASTSRYSDEAVVRRVRSKIERLTSQPDAIGVSLDRGRVVLSGTILLTEVDELCAGIRREIGVEEVENRLRADGTAKPSREKAGTLPPDWTPSGAV